MSSAANPTDFQPFSSSRLGGRRGPGKAAVVGSVILHGALVAGILLSDRLPSRAEQTVFKTYKVSLFSPPPNVEGEPVPAAAPKPEIIKKPVVAPEPKPAATKKADVKTATPTAAAAKPKPTNQVTGRNAKPGPVGGENLNILQEGEEFPDPVYLENIILQLNRYFRWSGQGNLRAEIGFQIHRDGRVTRVSAIRRSGNFEFDAAAVEAVEQAAKRGAFGPLPKVWPHDVLPVAFSFLPPR